MNFINNTPYPKLYIQKSVKKIYPPNKESIKINNDLDEINIINKTLKYEKQKLQQHEHMKNVFKSRKSKPYTCSTCKK